MNRRIPILPTLVVLAAVAVMLRLGFWQLDRAAWKEGLLARYAQASNAVPAEFPLTPEAAEAVLYRRASVTCDRVLSLGGMAGHTVDGQPGWAQVARCVLGGGGEADVVLGVSDRPNPGVEWSGGAVSGIIGPGRDGEARLIADPPQAGLAAHAAPDPNDLPNNHMSYAVQWFLFALTALVIYALALRKRWLAQAGGSD